MTFLSAHFGTILVDEQSIVEFPEGLPGFEDRRRFLPLQAPEQDGLVFLQSLEVADLCFLALPVQAARPNYEIVLTPEDRQTLGLAAAGTPVIGRDVAALAILSLVEGQEPTANLHSPVIIHMETRVAVQAIRPDEQYQCREPLILNRCEAVCS
ncbi:MAG TPA: flagellar assembly protein FliW [Candidatus Sulfopaludibacter sp.]|jgi:flagellar assembly factor FliW|nr:flagellar assembly protein FliW [Candidatus Sulfopaludibacter sp.]